MKSIVLIMLTLVSTMCKGQNAETYFNLHRNNEALMTAFFMQMPKGGDLHHHYSGSVYAETYFETAVAADCWVNINTLFISQLPKTDTSEWKSLSMLKKSGRLPEFRLKLLQKWSVKDYEPCKAPSDKHFFETFMYFGSLSRTEYAKGLLELKQRALLENVSYIETMFIAVPSAINTTPYSPYNEKMRTAIGKGDTLKTMQQLDSLYRMLMSAGASDHARIFNNDFVQKLHSELKLDDDKFTMRYQNTVVRVQEPVEVFKNMVLAFESASKSPLIVGVNILAPEDNVVSMNDYSLHMLMYKYCHNKYPAVRYSMHAGELTTEQVKPEQLSFHIRDAVYVAGASRIGHGVDIAYENNCYTLLKSMHEKKIAVEINLTSNEFILGVKGNAHPISLYRLYDVPLVICTDDAGVLRSNLAQQFVLLALHYPDVSYADIKQYVYNSIRYSFIEEPEVVKELINDLDKRFALFEAQFR